MDMFTSYGHIIKQDMSAGREFYRKCDSQHPPPTARHKTLHLWGLEIKPCCQEDEKLLICVQRTIENLRHHI